MSKELGIFTAQLRKPISCPFGLVTQPFELTARPADDVDIDPLQGRTQLRPIEVAVVVDPALNVRVGHATAHADRPRDPLARRHRRLAETRLTFVRRIAEYAPHRRALPATASLVSGDGLFVHQPSDGANAEAMNAV